IVLQVNVDGQSLTRAVTVEGGEIVPQTLANSPVLSSRSACGDPYVLELGEHRIGAEILHLLPNGFEGPNDICLGYDPSVTTTANFEGMSRFEWDGEIGYGLTERSLRMA
ncbi:MAG TPA: hypothetical protein VGP90_01110, partial [Acidimicrobiia bacterium]|nr:hypothetical protein [Acidimicrobiia bacterium]